MDISKEKVVEALKKVMYFPKGEDVISLRMIKDLSVEGKRVAFTIVFPKLQDKTANIVKTACENAVLNDVDAEADVRGNVKVEYNPKAESEKSLAKVKHIIAVASGKGGVGKSTIAVNLAVAFARAGFKTGILDADIYGPSVPLMFGVTEEKPRVIEQEGKTKILPLEKYGVKILSIGFFVDPKQALIWRGPMASNALGQLFSDAEWGELDYMVVDIPPGTGDIHLTLVQQISLAGVAIVSTPQEVALADARKAFSMFRQKDINVPVLGLIENMSWFTPAELPENKYYIFGREGGKKLAQESNVNFLGEIPIVQGIRESGDSGKPAALDGESIVGKAFDEAVQNIIKSIDNR